MIPMASETQDLPRVGDEFFTLKRGSGGVIGRVRAVTPDAGVKPVTVWGVTLLGQVRGEWYFDLDELVHHPGDVWEAR